MNRLELFKVNEHYAQILFNIDRRVPYVSGDKANRPFIGVVLEVNGCKYFAPMTSPKPKHLKMNDSTMPDFIRINNGAWGGINLNNMIPVADGFLTKVDIGKESNEDYKNLLTNQISWCNKNREKITKKAQRLYNLVCKGNVGEALLNRCCDYKLLEEMCKEYIAEKAAAFSSDEPSGSVDFGNEFEM